MWKSKLIWKHSRCMHLVFPKALQNAVKPAAQNRPHVLRADRCQPVSAARCGLLRRHPPQSPVSDLTSLEDLIQSTQSNKFFCTSAAMWQYQGLWHRSIWSSKVKSLNECVAHALFIMLNLALELGNTYTNSVLGMWFYIPHLENSIKKSRCLAKKKLSYHFELS